MLAHEATHSLLVQYESLSDSSNEVAGYSLRLAYLRAPTPRVTPSGK